MPKPTVPATRIKKLLAGEEHCAWAAWFPTHHDARLRESEFDFQSWRVNHTALVNRAVADLRARALRVSVENQNRFELSGSRGVLSGKPDAIATGPGDNWIVDAKTGKPHLSDKLQVMIYMWAVPLALPQYKGVRFDGLVLYPNYRQIVTADEITPEFVKIVGDTVSQICSPTAPWKVPSKWECGYCKISDDDCGERVGAETADEPALAATDAF